MPSASAAASNAHANSIAYRGTWDVGPFDNDTASDWYLTFTDAPTWTGLHEAFAATTALDYVDADTASIAVAAAAIVSAADQQRFDSLPPEGREGIAALGKPSPSLVREAQGALSRVERDSELAELWNEGDPADWLASLNSIRTGLK